MSIKTSKFLGLLRSFLKTKKEKESLEKHEKELRGEIMEEMGDADVDGNGHQTKIEGGIFCQVQLRKRVTVDSNAAAVMLRKKGLEKYIQRQTVEEVTSGTLEELLLRGELSQKDVTSVTEIKEFPALIVKEE